LTAIQIYAQLLLFYDNLCQRNLLWMLRADMAGEDTITLQHMS